MRLLASHEGTSQFSYLVMEDKELVMFNFRSDVPLMAVGDCWNTRASERHVVCVQSTSAFCSMLNALMMDEPINNQFTSN